MPGYQNCCAKDFDCEECSDKVPRAFLLTLAGNANLATPDCTACESFDGSYLVPATHVDCIWQTHLPDYCEEVATPLATISITKIGSKYWLHCTIDYGELGGPTGHLTYAHDFGTSALDCATIDQDMDYSDQTEAFMNICEPTGITMNVLAV